MDYDQAMFLFGGGKGNVIRFTTQVPGTPQPEKEEEEKEETPEEDP